MHYDGKRKLLWSISSKGDVRVLKLDLKGALAEPAPERPGGGKEGS